MRWIEEIHHDISTIQSSLVDLKKFGLTIGGVLLLLCGAALLKNWWSHAVLYLFSSFGIFLIVSGMFFPKLLHGVHRWWMSVAIVLGSVVSRIILFFVFFSVVTIISLSARIFGKKFYIAHNDQQRSTYWIPRDRNRPINYEKMS